jgi:parallel beta-helix repeat protein
MIINSSGLYALNQSLAGAPIDISGTIPVTSACLVISAPNVTLYCDGFNITGNGTGGTTRDGIVLNASANSTIEDCPGVSNYTDGVVLYQSSGSNVTDSVAYNDSNDGFYLTSSPDSALANDSAIQAGYIGFDSVSSDNSSFIGNTANDSGWDGFYITTSSNVTVANNLAGGAGYSGIYLYTTSNSLLANNTAASNFIHGLVLYGGSNNNLLIGNTLHDNGHTGIYLTASSDNNTVANNFAYNNTSPVSGFGFVIDSSLGNTLENNTAYNNSYGIGLYYGENNSIYDDNLSENGYYDLYVYADTNDECDQSVTNLTGSGNRPVYYADSSVNISNAVFSELVLCNAPGSTLDNITIRGSDSRQNNFLYVLLSPGTVIANSDSSDNREGFDIENTPTVSLINDSASNNSAESYFFFSSDASFSGTNYALNTPPGAVDLEAIYSTVTTRAADGNYSFINTSYGSYGFENATNLSMTAEPLSSTAAVSPAACSNETCKLVTDGQNVVEVGTFPPYLTASLDSLALPGPTGTDTYVSLFSSGEWADLSQLSLDNTTGLVTGGPFTEFGPFGVVEFVNPTITLDSPDNSSLLNTSTVDFNFTATDNLASPINCSIYLDSVLNATNSSVTNDTESNFTISGIAPGSHTWYVQCTDNANNTATSETRNLTVRITDCPPAITTSGTFIQPGDYSGAPNDASDVSPDSYACVMIDAPNVLFDCNGSAISGNAASGTTQYGILVLNSTNVTVRNCPEISNYTEGIYVYQSNDSSFVNDNAYNNADEGFYSDSNSNLTFVNDSSYNNSENGFGLYSGSGTALANDSADDDGQYGFYLTSSYNTTFSNDLAYNNPQDGFEILLSSNNTLANNLAYGNSVLGFDIEYNSGNIITNNSAYNNSEGGFDIYDYNDVNPYDNLTGNTAYDNSESGFFIEYSSNDSLTNNSAYNNSNYGFRFFTVSNAIIANDSAYDNGQCGFYFYSGSNTSFTNNSAYSNLDDGFDIILSSNNTITNNLALNNSPNGFFLSSSPNNTVAGNSAYNSYQNGFTLVSADNNNITGNSAYNSGSFSFISQGASDSFTDNTAYDSVIGFYLFYSPKTTLANNSASGNPYGGLSIYDSDNTSLQGMHLSNNTPDVLVQDDFGSPITLNLSGLIFDNPLGNMQDYTNLSINDTVDDGETYSISWAGSPSPPPSGNVSFDQKFVNISTLSGTPSIDSIVWSWTNAEAIGHAASSFALWEYNSSGWTLLNNTPDTVGNTLSVASLAPGGVYGIMDNDTTPPIFITNYGGSTRLRTFSIDLNSSCTGNIVSVTSGDMPISGATVLVDDAASMANISSGTSDADGQLNFTGCGLNVRITVVKGGYQTAQIINQTMACGQCVQCTQDTGCPDTDSCVNQSCVAVQCSCGQVADHECSAYECCSDSQCISGQICQDHTCVQQNTTQNNTRPQNATTAPTQADASAAIAAATSAVDSASGSGKNVTEAQSELAQAEAAFSSGNYALAVQLAEQSEQLAANAAAAPAPQANLTGTSTAAPSQPFNWLLAICVIVILLIVGLVYYLITRKPPKRRSS